MYGQEHGEHQHLEAHVAEDAGIEVDVRIKLLLGEILLVALAGHERLRANRISRWAPIDRLNGAAAAHG